MLGGQEIALQNIEWARGLVVYLLLFAIAYLH